MVAILSECTGQTTERITTDIDRDYILRDEAAISTSGGQGTAKP